MPNSFRGLRRVVAALMLTSALVAATAALAPGVRAQPAQDAASYEAYAYSGYTYCDAKLVGALFQTDPNGGKLWIGYKLRQGWGDSIPALLAEARRLTACEWTDTPHSYADAERLAAIWGLADPYDAKLKVASYYTAGQSSIVVSLLS